MKMSHQQTINFTITKEKRFKNSKLQKLTYTASKKRDEGHNMNAVPKMSVTLIYTTPKPVQEKDRVIQRCGAKLVGVRRVLLVSYCRLLEGWVPNPCLSQTTLI